MKLKFYGSGKIEQGFALIGKTGQIRLKSAFAQSMDFKKDERWLVGTDEDEKPIKHIYILRPKREEQHNGFKMQYQNKSWFLSGKTVINELNLQPPIKCHVEPFKKEGFDGFRLVLP
ncbi:hypothetical protein [Hymenobacter aerophilus]|uniref:hypothetical protein n=1 Tax=Hymenobacter aerophilus TaxID=119644 RepID=UPI00035E0F47|nr:hypothetical protein [Hymenobacter aerophilus]